MCYQGHFSATCGYHAGDDTDDTVSQVRIYDALTKGILGFTGEIWVFLCWSHTCKLIVGLVMLLHGKEMIVTCIWCAKCICVVVEAMMVN